MLAVVVVVIGVVVVVAAELVEVMAVTIYMKYENNSFIR